MAETVSIILEYLRQNKFTKAEAALCLELQARQGLKEPIFLLPRDLDLLLGEPAKEDTAIYSDKIFPEDESLCKVALDSWSKGPSNRLRALEVHLKGWEPESTSCDEASGPGTLTMHQKLVYENSERDSYHCDSLDIASLPSATFASAERRLSYDIARGPTIKDIESGISTQRVDFQRSKHSTKGIGPMCLKDQITEEGAETAERIIEVQNDQEEFPIRHENNTSTFLQQDALDTHTGRVDCVVEHIIKASPFCEPYEQAANALKIGMQRWERSPDISSHEQQEMPAYQPEQCTIVYESRDFSEHYSFNGKSQFEQGALFPEFLQNHHDSFTSIAYGASADNGWFDHCLPSNTCSKTSSNGILTGSFQPSFLSCPIIEDFPDQHEQRNKNHALHEVSKAYSFERESRPVDYLKDIAVPWEVAFQNEETQLGGFEEGKNCTDESRCTGFPRLAHVNTRSIEKDLSVLQDSNGSFYINSALDGGHDRITIAVSEPSFSLGSFLDIPVGQNTPLSGSNWQNGSSHLSISQGIVEDTPELLSGFATLGHEPSDSGMCYPQEYWESDAYEDDEDPGYHRQPIEDEAWFLAHEIEYPSDDDKANTSKTIGSHFQNCQNNCEHDDFSQAEQESYFSREHFYKAGHNKPQTSLGQEEVNMLNPCAKSSHCIFVERSMIPNMSYGVRLMNAEELKLVKTEHILEGFDSKINQTDVLGGEKSFQAGGKSCEQIFNKINDDSSGSVRFGDAGISCDAQDLGSKEKNSILAAYREREKESLGDLDDHSYQDGQIVLGPDNILYRVGNDASRCRGDFTGESDVSLRCVSSDWVSNRFYANKQNAARRKPGQAKYIDGHPYDQIQDLEDGFGTGCGSFSFQSPESTDDLTVSKRDFGKSVQITESTPLIEDADGYVAGINRQDDTLTSLKGKGDGSSPILSLRGEAVLNGVSSLKSVVFSHSNYDSLLCEARREKYDAGIYEEEEIDAAVIDDEDTDALQKEVQHLKVEEDEYEIFNLRIVHRKNRTGFEEEKNFPIVINSVIAGRYLVTEYLGSAAFSKAIQARDLQTGMDVCMKIIKNNKDFFDQSLDEIKLLKFINKHDPADKYHILRLYDYFYYREHLFIVCELLRANLYEFHKFNRESGGEMYFTMSRLQSITRQCLEALEFLHGLGLIHCDLKPENILVKSYSRCEVKVIDLGSSCFQLDHLCPYVQSRSYRAPEVILGLLYNQKIDIWSLGCILAELCSGHVLFQNDSIATLLARVFGIIGPVNPEVLAKGRDTYKYFTRHYMLYERNQETNQLEYLLPKKTSLRHRLPMGDQGFVDFVGYLLQINPENRPTASEALKHPWLSYPYEPLSS